MLKLTLEAIQVLDIIAREGSFAAAAEYLNKVPSAISYTVSKMEEQLDMLIFDRKGPRATLTAAGLELLKEGRWIIAAARDLESRLRKIAKGFESELLLVHDSLIPTAALVPDLLAFEQLNCGTRLHIGSETMSGTWEALRELRADIIIAAGENPLAGEVQTAPIGLLEFGFYVAPQHPLAQREEALTEADLREHAAIVVGDSARALPPRTTGLLSGQRRILVPDMVAKLALQKAGLGFGFLPTALAQEALAAGELVACQTTLKKAPERFYLAWRNESEGEGLKWWHQRLARRLIPDLITTWENPT